MKSETHSVEDLIYKPLSGEWGDDIGEINVLRTTNFNNDGTLNLSEVVKRSIDSSKVEKKKLKFGDTIIEKSGGSPSQPVGRVVYFNIKDETFLCNNFTSVIRPKENLHSRYLFWYLYHNHLNQNTRKYQNKTTGIINLQLERYIKELQIPLPSLPIQKRIAEILDAADALKRKDQELLKKYDELAQAIFIDMFGDPVKNEKGWEVKRLGQHCDVGSSVRVFVEELVGEGVAFYRGTEIGALSVGDVVKPTLFITDEHYHKLKIQGGVPQIGDLLMPSICPDGRIFEVKDENPFYFKDGRVLWIKVDKTKYNSVYLKYLLKETFFRSYLKIASGTTFAELKIFALKDLELCIPPIKLQTQYAALVNKIITQKSYSVQTSTNSIELFNSLIQKAFKGELVS
ncbi:MAG: restriction endonuclease subunit S [Daejeonella sp.]